MSLRSVDIDGAPARTDDAFSILVEVSAALCSTLHLRDLLGAMMERAREVVHAEACSVMLVDESEQALRWEVALGAGAGRLQTLMVPLGSGISGRVAATGEPIRIEDAQCDPRWQGQRYDAETGISTGSILCVPIRARERVIGVIQVLNRQGGAFTDDDQRLLEGLAGLGGVAIENARLYEHLEEEVQDRTADLTRTLTELRATQAQLVQSEKMAALGDLVAGVAHEINTPLGAITSNTDLVGRAIAKATAAAADPAQHAQLLRLLERVAQMATVSHEACQRIAGIVRSLRNFARLDEAERKPADLHEGLESTLTLVSHLLKTRITVQREYGQLPLIDCYPNQLNQVFLNLLVNAAQAIADQGTITLRTRHDPGLAADGLTPAAGSGSVVIEISDTGCGIAPEHMKKIFDPGFTTKGVGVGTGLGLAISYRIVNDHRGSITVESTGTGTTFCMRLPVTAPGRSQSI